MNIGSGMNTVSSLYGQQKGKKDTFDQKAEKDKRNRADRTAYPTDRRTGRINGGV